MLFDLHHRPSSTRDTHEQDALNANGSIRVDSVVGALQVAREERQGSEQLILCELSSEGVEVLDGIHLQDGMNGS